MSFLWSAFSGWSAVLLLGAGIAVPYLARNLRWSNLLPHYVLGLLIPVAASLHAFLAMSLLRIHRSELWGLLPATAAMVVMIRQAGLGMAVREATGRRRQEMRRAHFWTMAVVLVLVFGHIEFNRA